MSNSRSHRRQLTDAQARVAAALGPLDGARLPGGCGHCDAYHTVRPLAAGMWGIRVHHDETCPLWLLIQAGR